MAAAPEAQPESPPKAPARPLRAAVLQLEAGGLEPHVVRLLDESLLAELRKRQRVSVVGMDEIRQMLDFEAQKQLLGCEEGDSCLAEIADSLGVDVLVTGTATQVGTETIFALRRIDQRSASVAGTFTKRLAFAGGEEVLAAIGPAVQELFADLPLRPGQAMGVAPEVALRLNPPPVSPSVTIALASSATAVVVAAGAAFATTAWMLEDYRSFARGSGGTGDGVNGAVLVGKGQTAEAAWVTSWVLLGGGLALGGVTAALVPLTDWNDVGGEP